MFPTKSDAILLDYQHAFDYKIYDRIARCKRKFVSYLVYMSNSNFVCDAILGNNAATELYQMRDHV